MVSHFLFGRKIISILEQPAEIELSNISASADEKSYPYFLKDSTKFEAFGGVSLNFGIAMFYFYTQNHTRSNSQTQLHVYHH